jgi:hypothetical protein
VTY